MHDVPGTLGSTAAVPPVAAGSSVFKDAVNAKAPRTNWTREEISEIYNQPLMELAFAAVCFSLDSYQYRNFELDDVQLSYSRPCEFSTDFVKNEKKHKLM